MRLRDYCLFHLIVVGAILTVNCRASTPAFSSSDVEAPGAAEPLQRVLEGSLDVNSVDPFTGESPLHLAAKLDEARAVAQLLDRGADTDATDDMGRTALHLAAAHGASQACVLLLATGARVDIRDEVGNTPLMLASDANASEVAEVLIAHGADVQIENSVGKTPLHVACRAGALRTAQLLVKSGADPAVQDSAGQTPLRDLLEPEPLRRGQDEADARFWFAKWLLSHGAQHDPLTAAAMGEVTILENDLRADADLQNDRLASLSAASLRWAAAWGKSATVEWLVQAGADVNAPDPRGYTALHMAAGSSQLLCVRRLIDAGALVNIADRAGHRPIHFASRAGTVSILELLMASGASVRVRDGGDFIPLHYAAEAGKVNAVHFLLTKAPDLVDARSEVGYTPLQEAASEGGFAVLQVLAEAGSDLSEFGPDALAAASRNGHVLAAQTLVDLGVPVNSMGSDGWRSVDLAVSGGRLPVTQVLLHAGADMGANDEHGTTPLEVASVNEDMIMLWLLRRYGDRK